MMIEPKNDGRGRMQYDLPPGTQQLFIRKEEVMQFFNLVEREPRGFGMARTALFTELKQAVAADSRDSPIHTAVDPLCGDNVRDWLNKVAREFLQAKCEPQERFTGKHPALGAPYGTQFAERIEDPRDAYTIIAANAVPTLEPNVDMVEGELTDELLDSYAGRTWIAYTARVNQYESAFGHRHLTIPARIECMRRAMDSQEEPLVMFHSGGVPGLQPGEIPAIISSGYDIPADFSNTVRFAGVEFVPSESPFYKDPMVRHERVYNEYYQLTKSAIGVPMFELMRQALDEFEPGFELQREQPPQQVRETLK